MSLSVHFTYMLIYVWSILQMKKQKTATLLLSMIMYSVTTIRYNSYLHHNDQLIYDTETPQAFLYKMAARGHFDFPIDAKNHKVLLIWDLNGYGEYEFDWCICDKDMACTSVGVRLGQWRRNQKQHP